MSILEEILDFNQEFVASGEYAQFFSNKYPERELAILSCMDARMVELLPRALGLKNGDAKLIKNAGAVVTHPWGSVMRSLLVAVLELKVKEIMVVAHYDCGMRGLNADAFLGKAREQGIEAPIVLGQVVYLKGQGEVLGHGQGRQQVEILIDDAEMAPAKARPLVG